MHAALKILVFSSSSFVALFILSKLMGKKQISQLDFVDYAIGISIGSIASEMATETQRPIYYYIIAMTMFFLLDLAVTFIGRKGTLFKKILKGKPLVLIYEGKLVAKNLKKSRLDVNDFLMLLRGKDYFDVSQIEYALFENNGTLSIMPIGQERPTVTRDLPIPVEKAELPNFLVIDGKVSGSGLSEIAKNKEWLFKHLNIQDKKALKNILLASYDKKNDDVIVHYQSY